MIEKEPPENTSQYSGPGPDERDPETSAALTPAALDAIAQIQARRELDEATEAYGALLREQLAGNPISQESLAQARQQLDNARKRFQTLNPPKDEEE